MYRIESKIDNKSGEYKKNHANMKKVVKQFKERLAEIQKGGPEKYQKLQKSRGKLLVRERLDKLFDRNTPFLELNSLAAYDMYDNQAPGAGMVTGIGVVHGRVRNNIYLKPRQNTEISSGIFQKSLLFV